MQKLRKNYVKICKIVKSVNKHIKFWDLSRNDKLYSKNKNKWIWYVKIALRAILSKILQSRSIVFKYLTESY